MTPETAREWGVSNARVFVDGLGGIWPDTIRLHPRDALLMSDNNPIAAEAYRRAFLAECDRLRALD